ncbi:uncharacterized protein LOC130988042 [Salvia miltiorrhiza]|uniref:uncharacterized protein LOC130988042 n=1 Tax=Salvia miltiorrhiza TaxID=226208 RepID=UPI0025ACF347|nr:uncharacterized protein LOC130988042 [Salvia miltiorrhiza]
MKMMFSLKVITLVTILAAAAIQARNVPGYSKNILDDHDVDSIKGETETLFTNRDSMHMPRWLIGIGHYMPRVRCDKHHSTPPDLGKDDPPPPPPPQPDSGPRQLYSYRNIPLNLHILNKE